MPNKEIIYIAKDCKVRFQQSDISIDKFIEQLRKEFIEFIKNAQCTEEDGGCSFIPIKEDYSYDFEIQFCSLLKKKDLATDLKNFLLFSHLQNQNTDDPTFYANDIKKYIKAILTFVDAHKPKKVEDFKVYSNKRGKKARE